MRRVNLVRNCDDLDSAAAESARHGPKEWRSLCLRDVVRRAVGRACPPKKGRGNYLPKKLAIPSATAAANLAR
jgi:hypothetical protein